MQWLRVALGSLGLVACGRVRFDPIAEDTSSIQCAPSYVLSAGTPSRYRRGSPRTWAAAEADCEADGGHLVVIDAAEENAFVESQLAGGPLWIGLSDHLAEGSMRWVTGALIDFDAFDTGQPNNDLGTEDCVDMFELGVWNDTECTRDFDYVCECDGLPVEPTACDTDANDNCGECGTVCPAGTSCIDQICS